MDWSPPTIFTEIIGAEVIMYDISWHELLPHSFGWSVTEPIKHAHKRKCLQRQASDIWNQTDWGYLIPDCYDAKIGENIFWTFWPIIQLINHLFKFRQKAFWPVLHRCKKCSNMSLHFSHLWSIGQNGFCRILKIWFISLFTGQNV